MLMNTPATRFAIEGNPVSCERYGSGHINQTYLLTCDSGLRYILQKINTNIFTNPDALMQNIFNVTEHLRKRATDPREVLTVVQTTDGKPYLNENGESWRMYVFVEDSLSLDKAETVDDFRESAIAFGRFQCLLSDFDAAALVETIPNFHHTPLRFEALKKAITADSCGRASSVQREIEFALAREEYALTLVALQMTGDLPLRVTHNDTKLNNVLLDAATRKALCVIDLDTVMPGLMCYDFGDSIRFGASTAAEDETNLDKVTCSLKLFEAYTGGFLSQSRSSMTPCERETLRDGAKMMTLECGIRFLTDYLQGDTYFHTTREGHNLDRCRTQLKLVADMESKWDELQKIVLA